MSQISDDARAAAASADKSLDELRGRYEGDIESLRSEIAKLRDQIGDKASKAYDRVAEGVSNAADQVQEEAASVVDTIREHPAATTTLFTLIGAVGFAIGFAVASTVADSRNNWYRRYLGERF